VRFLNQSGTRFAGKMADGSGVWSTGFVGFSPRHVSTRLAQTDSTRQYGVTPMNLRVMIRRLAGRPTLRIGARSTLGWDARILNAGANSSAIRVGANCRVEGELFVFAHGGDIRIGDWCFIGPGSRVWSALEIDIGSRVLISHNCTIIDSLTHPLDPHERHMQYKAIIGSGHPGSIDLDEKPVRIEDDAWIGAGATILRGVTVGKAGIVGAGSVVTSDVPPYTIVAGNPARVIRRIESCVEKP
jgi:acetyltransferase-like isoleucine patch superfamily enzyme